GAGRGDVAALARGLGVRVGRRHAGIQDRGLSDVKAGRARGYNEGRRVDLHKISGARMHWYGTVLLALTLILGLATDGWAGAPTEQLRAYTDQILKVLEYPSLSLPDKRKMVRRVAHEAFATTAHAQRARG